MATSSPKPSGKVPKDRFQDSCYELRVSGKELNKLDRGTARRFASEIGNVIVQTDPSKIPMRRSVPLHWTFPRADRDEYEDRRGSVVIQQDRTRKISILSPPLLELRPRWQSN
jgi:hypothetical protein